MNFQEELRKKEKEFEEMLKKSKEYNINLGEMRNIILKGLNDQDSIDEIEKLLNLQVIQFDTINTLIEKLIAMTKNIHDIKVLAEMFEIAGYLFHQNELMNYIITRTND